MALRRCTTRTGYAQAAFRVPASDLTDQSVDYHAHVGLTPKMLARVMRARAALGRPAAARMAHPRNVNLGAIAYELGYYDQPHFIDDIKEITGKRPASGSADPSERSETRAGSGLIC